MTSQQDNERPAIEPAKTPTTERLFYVAIGLGISLIAGALLWVSNSGPGTHPISVPTRIRLDHHVVQGKKQTAPEPTPTPTLTLFAPLEETP